MASHDLLHPLSFYENLSPENDVSFTHGECFEVLKQQPNDMYDCCVTSPPYYFVRDYGHDDQIGLEKTRAHYIERLTKVFSEVHRTLKPTGSLWLNVADNYVTRRALRDDGKRTVAKGGKMRSWADSSAAGKVITGAQFRSEGLKEKSLFNIPHLLVESLMQNGWYWRAEFIWIKPQAVPEKQRDAPVNAIEYVFLLTKRENGYVYHNEILREKGSGEHPEGRPHRNLWEIGPSRFRSSHTALMPEELAARCILTGSDQSGLILDPFAGAGTTGVAARLFGRKAHLIEINEDYIDIARQRIKNVSTTRVEMSMLDAD